MCKRGSVIFMAEIMERDEVLLIQCSVLMKTAVTLTRRLEVQFSHERGYLSSCSDFFRVEMVNNLAVGSGKVPDGNPQIFHC